MPEWRTPLLCPVWWSPTLASFSRTRTEAPGLRRKSLKAVASPTIPPPTPTSSYTRRLWSAGDRGVNGPELLSGRQAAPLSHGGGRAREARPVEIDGIREERLARQPPRHQPRIRVSALGREHVDDLMGHDARERPRELGDVSRGELALAVTERSAHTRIEDEDAVLLASLSVSGRHGVRRKAEAPVLSRQDDGVDPRLGDRPKILALGSRLESDGGA